MKKCTKCKEEKPFEEFHKHKRSKDGRQSSCRGCQKQYYENNREKIREQNKQYRENNKEKVREANKQYRENNREKIREQNKQYRENNKEKIREWGIQYYENNKEYYKEYSKQYRKENKEKERERKKQYRENNKEKILEYHKQWYENNKEKVRERGIQYYDNNKEKILEYRKQYYENNRKKIIEWQKQYQSQRYKNDPEFRLRMSISRAFHHFLNGNKEKPTSEYLKQCGYTRKELMKHLEGQFDQNMTWDNYGSYWHVDHIIPQSVFEATNEQHLKWCWSLENLRPLEAWENISKNNCIIPEEIKKISFYEDVKHLLKD